MIFHKVDNIFKYPQCEAMDTAHFDEHLMTHTGEDQTVITDNRKSPVQNVDIEIKKDIKISSKCNTVSKTSVLKRKTKSCRICNFETNVSRVLVNHMLMHNDKKATKYHECDYLINNMDFVFILYQEIGLVLTYRYLLDLRN